MWSEIYDVIVGDDGNCTNQHFRSSKGTILRLKLSPSLEFRKIEVKTNMPMTKDHERFIRNKYYTVLPTCGYLIPLRLAGAFNYFIKDSQSSEILAEGCFVVEPELRVGPRLDKVIKPEEISCQTYVVKSLGPLKEWKERLQVAKECGFNMVHLTPVQQLGASNSSYSIRDQFSLNSTLQCGDMGDLINFVDNIRREWKVLTISDVVLNHTSKCSPWIAENPESCYNLKICPHLRPAYLVDRAIFHFNNEISQGKFKSRGLPPQIRSEEHLGVLHNLLKCEIFPRLKIHEMFCCNVDNVINEFLDQNFDKPRKSPVDDVTLITDKEFRRNKASVDMFLAQRLYDKAGNLEDLRRALMKLNEEKMNEINRHVEVAASNCVDNARYNFVDPRGHKWDRVSQETPIMRFYFMKLRDSELTLDEEEKEMYGENSKYMVSFNGWVMGWDSLKDFAAPDSNIYLRRELVVWGDSVKLRYGGCFEDSPYLWKRIEDYVTSVARIFHGIRLDNCHSTPLHVAQYMMDAMRRVNPDLYVVAELFTGSEETDSIFSNLLGITTLVREAFNAWDPHELGRLVYKFGGNPVGTFNIPFSRTLTPSLPHAMLMDLTHDNPSPLKERSLLYLLPTSSLISIAGCAIGSTRGYDEFIPHHIDIVKEKRLYMPFCINSCNLHKCRLELNNLHSRLWEEGYDEIFVDQMTPNVIAITRRNSVTLSTVIMIAYNSFNNDYKADVPCRPLCVQGDISEILLEASVYKDGNTKYVPDDITINGIEGLVVSIAANFPPGTSKMLEISKNGDQNVISLTFNFTPGSVVAFRVDLPSELAALQSQVLGKCEDFIFNEYLYGEIDKLTLLDLNKILFRHHSEETDSNKYYIPDYDFPVYNGLQGQMSLIDEIIRTNHQTHPLCRNLRDGNWLMNHTVDRLFNLGFKSVGTWLSRIVDVVGRLPRSAVPPKYFYVVSGLHSFLTKRCERLLSDDSDRGTLMRMLKLGSVVLFGEVEGASLPPVAVELSNKASLAAGLPHFSHGVFRNWGRDTFISLRGLLLLTGRFEEARVTILGFAGTLFNGLIPNLLGEGVCSRYNARDAVWFWLQSIKDYVTMRGKQGVEILNDHVLRLYPRSVESVTPKIQPLHDVMQEALVEHFVGISFREINAGFRIDNNMSDEGFNVTAGVSYETGFIYGGNLHNCGTWMDKMGSCEASGNKGIPASPRDGSAIELVGLCYSVVNWLAQLHEQGIYPYKGVERQSDDGSPLSWTWSYWAQIISENFEKSFYIPTESATFSPHVFRRGIYKDCLGSSQSWADYQLRPNFCLAMVCAPELFDVAHAWGAIRLAEDILLGPLGMKTLDPKDWNYNGAYTGDVVSDPKLSCGFNYHQGPEWIWICGIFLRAKWIFSKRMDFECPGISESTRAIINKYVMNHYNAIKESEWRGLDELTNENGAYCYASCRIQAWSMATFIELLHDLNNKSG